MCHHLLLSLDIETNVTCDHFADGSSAHELADPFARHCRVVGNDCQVPLSLTNNLVDYSLWRADGHEATDHETRSIGDHRNGMLKGDRAHFRSFSSRLVALVQQMRLSSMTQWPPSTYMVRGI